MKTARAVAIPLLLQLALGGAARVTLPVAQAEEYPVPPPPLSDGIFPCSDCHADLEPDPTPRVLGMHEEIVERFHHAEAQRWCLDCHNPSDRDKLRLANGELIDFGESYKLCGQCHGTNFRDWRAGVHGKRTGMWNGRKEYRLCVHCHDPHRPRFAPIAPEPEPRRPWAIDTASEGEPSAPPPAHGQHGSE
ncbi:hypothetical protein FJ251_05835 [bacterium]|nr:hypothetical protein [bacterium]